MKILKIAVIILVVVAPQIVSARQFYQLGRVFRGLSMGNTGVVSAHDNDAIFYNPASLPNVQKSFFDIFSLQIHTPEGVEKIIDTFSATRNRDPEKIGDFLKNAPSKGRVGYLFMSNFNYQAIDRGWNIAGAYAIEFDQLYQISKDNDLTEGLFSTRLDEITAVAISYPFNYGEYVIGVGGKHITRRTLNYEYTLSQAEANEKPPDSDAFTRGEAFAVDFGFLYRLPGSSRFRAGFSVLNAGGLNFDDDASPKWPQEINIGIAAGPTFGRWRTLIAFDYRDVNQENGTKADGSKDASFIRRSHFGVELGYYVESKTFALLNLRAGINQGLPTFGIEMNFLFGRTIVLGYTYYNEDIGDSGTKIEAPSNMVYVSVGI